jgi:nucleotide-binding universal stress UspA family protein
MARFDDGRRLRRILFATDFSRAAMAALPHAARLARDSGAQLYVAHIIELQPWELSPELSLQTRIDATRRLDQVLACAELRGIETRSIVRHGRAAAELVRAAQEHAIDLVVMGTRSRRGLNHWIGASAAEELAACAPCPVLAVGPLARPARLDAPFRNIVLATGLNPGAAAGITYAHSFAEAHGAKLWVAHAMRPHTPIDEGSTQRWLRKLIPDRPDIERVAEVGTVEQVTIMLAERESADLVMLGPGLGSLLPLVSRQVACPVMMIRYAIAMIRPKSFGAVPAIGS